VLVAVVFLLVGAVVLVIGTESAIRGAARFASVVGMSGFVLGALLFGIDIEGLSAALIAAAKGQTAIAAGEAFGTVVFLFGAGLGLALMISRGPVPAPSITMTIAPAVPVAACAAAIYDRYVTRTEGLLLVLLYAGYVIAVVAEGRVVRARAREIEHEAEEVRGGAFRASLIGAAGLVAVYAGAWLLVQGGVKILAQTTLAAGFVGAALVGTLASLDEVLLEALPILRGAPDLATGNLFGTVAAFSTAVIGLAALVRPLVLDSAAALAFLAAAAMYAIVAVIFVLRGRVGKGLGLVILGAYVAWLAYAATL
jgi:cation:H+ antiporter